MNTAEFLQSLGHTPYYKLGSGSYGEAWELANDTVAKLTTSEAEEYCATRLFQLQETGEYSRFLPKIFEIGAISENVEFLEGTTEVAYWHGYSQPQFFYIREKLKPFPYPQKEDFQSSISYLEAAMDFGDVIAEAIAHAEQDIWEKTGMAILDSSPSNWGIRVEEDGTEIIVLQDLACGDEGGWWIADEQLDAIPFHKPRHLHYYR